MDTLKNDPDEATKPSLKPGSGPSRALVPLHVQFQPGDMIDDRYQMSPSWVAVDLVAYTKSCTSIF